MPPMRIAVCFDGRIIIHNHIPTNTLRALSLLPHVSYTVCFVPCAFLVTVRQPIHLHILFIIHFLPMQTRSLCFTPTTTPCDTHSFPVFLRFPVPPSPFPITPSTAIISEYPSNSRIGIPYYILLFLFSPRKRAPCVSHPTQLHVIHIPCTCIFAFPFPLSPSLLH